MATIINASTTSGLVQSADTSGDLALQSNGTTKLTVTSTGVNIGQFNGGVITSGTAVASTSGTSIDFTSIPSWVKRVTVMFNGVSTNGTSNYLVRLGTSSGFVTTGYVASTFTQNAGNQMVTTTSTAGLIANNIAGGGGSAAQLWSGFITINLLTGNTWVSSGNIINDVNGYPGTNAGSIALSGTLTQVRITTVNGTDTFDAGSINIMYEG